MLEESCAKKKEGGKWRPNNAGLHEGVISSLVFSSLGRPFWMRSPVGEFLIRNAPWGSLFVIQSLILQSTCEISLRKQFQKPLVNAEFLEVVIKRQSANFVWWPSLKVTPWIDDDLHPKPSNEGRMQWLGLHSLQRRFVRADLKAAFRTVTGWLNVDWNLLSLLLNRPSQTRELAFSVRIMKYWNKFPASVVIAPSVNIFGKTLDEVGWSFPNTPTLPHLSAS